ncbi:MAG: hypothetical protein ACRDBP_07065 [Luteolibacter sp.]
MNNQTLTLGHYSPNTALSARPVTREMVYLRTLELASSAGRSPRQIRQLDYERAKRELTGESDFDKQQALLDFNEYY